MRNVYFSIYMPGNKSGDRVPGSVPSSAQTQDISAGDLKKLLEMDRHLVESEAQTPASEGEGDDAFLKLIKKDFKITGNEAGLEEQIARLRKIALAREQATLAFYHSIKEQLRARIEQERVTLTVALTQILDEGYKRFEQTSASGK